MSEKIEAMLTMAFLLLVIMLLIAGGFYVYFTGIRIKDSTARKIEIFGYYLLVVLLVWQFGIKNILMGEFYTLDFYVIKQKLDMIFMSIRESITGNDWTELIPDYYSVEDGYIYVEQQMLFVDVTEMMMQIASTICIAIGRFQELIVKKREK